ncbi:2-deoxy-D-gluconate 3-dehydrogenase [Paucilactobacillus wasatchensis]|uniref:2-deoxy-D-gluconate 3-dehydrogenase n=1 Tax=Paucilactobacillus wasatchensis TaxID=1335616 RepID=A0A0D0YX82_9LACO|nr:2-deoxy-D-gluconate 3-dehydrogenase [Paucilactobacillus wasatchensis]
MAQSKEEIEQITGELDQFKMDWYSLDGKVAIITGGNTGLGQGYAVAMAEAGADVFIPTFGK